MYEAVLTVYQLKIMHLIHSINDFIYTDCSKESVVFGKVHKSVSYSPLLVQGVGFRLWLLFRFSPKTV
jgi:hypothetical protein